MGIVHIVSINHNQMIFRILNARNSSTVQVPLEIGGSVRCNVIFSHQHRFVSNRHHHPYSGNHVWEWIRLAYLCTNCGNLYEIYWAFFCTCNRIILFVTRRSNILSRTLDYTTCASILLAKFRIVHWIMYARNQRIDKLYTWDGSHLLMVGVRV